MVMGSCCEVEVGRENNFVNMFFPETARFRMTLDCLEDWKDHTTIKMYTMLIKIPFRILSINCTEGRLGKVIEGMCKCITGITTIEAVVLKCCHSKKEPLDWLINTRGIGVSKSM